MRTILSLGLLFVAYSLDACVLHHPMLRLPQKQVAPIIKQAAPFWVSPGVSGAWFNPQRSGEGWMIEMQESGEAVAVWFSYAPESEAPGQRWIVAQDGRVVGNRIEFAQTSTFSGGRFGPQFDPALVQAEAWGSLSFEFSDCANGRVTYDGRENFGEGSHAIVRLAGLHEADCNGVRATTALGARSAAGLRNVSGTWFDPRHNGEGLILEALTANQVAVTWFTYTDDGSPAWLLGVGTLQNNRLSVGQIMRPVGARFGAAFEPDDVVQEPWGRLDIEFAGCKVAALSYSSTQLAFGAGTQALQRLTSAAGAPCLDELPAARTSGRWTQGPTQPQPTSEVATAVLGSDIYVAGNYPTGREFLRYRTAADAWEILPPLPGGRDHALMLADASSLWLFGGYRAGPDQDAPGWRFRPADRLFETIVPAQPFGVGAVAASGAAVLNGWFYLGDTDGSLLQFDPRTGEHRRIAPQRLGLRDHAVVVSYLGEIWMLGGRTAEGEDRNTVSIYDPASEIWRNGPSLRESRAGFGAAVLDNQIMLAGGERVLLPRAVLRSVEIMAAGADQWAAGPELLTGVHGVGAAAVSGKLYMLGGSIRAGVALNPGVLQVYQPLP